MNLEWGVEYRGVDPYDSEEEARRQLQLAQWDVPAKLVKRINNGEWEDSE